MYILYCSHVFMCSNVLLFRSQELFSFCIPLYFIHNMLFMSSPANSKWLLCITWYEMIMHHWFIRVYFMILFVQCLNSDEGQMTATMYNWSAVRAGHCEFLFFVWCVSIFYFFSPAWSPKWACFKYFGWLIVDLYRFYLEWQWSSHVKVVQVYDWC